MSWKRSVKEVFVYRTDDLSLFSDVGREGYYRAFCSVSSNVTCLVSKVDAASVTYAMLVIHLFQCPVYTMPQYSKRSLAF